MEGVGLIVLGVLAGIFLVLWLVAHSRLVRPELVVIEPLHLVKSWQAARYVGRGSQVEQALKTLTAAKLGGSLLEELLPVNRSRPVKVAVLASQVLPLVGEQKVVRENGKTFSYVAGLRREVEQKLIITATEKDELKKLEETAGSHGFLVVLVGRTAVHAQVSKIENWQHVYLGAVLLEPVVDQKRIKNLSPTLPKKVLTCLPATLASYLAEKIGVTGSEYTVSPNDSAATFEQKVERAAVIALADADSRFRACRVLERSYRCHCQEAGSRVVNE